MNDERNSSDSERAKTDIEGSMEHVGNEDSECEKMIPEQVDTELSQEILYKTMHKIIGRSAKRRKQRRTVKAIRKKNRKADGDYRDESDEVYVPRATSRCSIPYLFEIIKLVCQSERLTALVTKIGFQHILALDECYVPRAFAQWVADCTIPEEKVIKFEGNSIQLSVYSVVQTLGIPEGELPVETDEEIGKASFLAAFNLTDLPTIKYFGNKILYEKNISDEDFCRCFMIVCNGTFLCPNSNTKPSTTYLGALVDVDKIKDRNWAKFVHEWLILFIKKYLNKKKRVDNKYLTLGGCIYHLAVRCLDFLDFGSIKLPRTMPRIHVWKGDMIKHFSDMTMGKDGKYGARSIIVESRTCYAKVENENEHTSVQANPICNQAVEVTNASNSRIIELLDMFSEQSMSKKMKEDIVDVFKNIMKDEDVILQSKVATLVSNVVKLLVNNNRESGDTEKVNCSQEVQNSTSVRNESQNTLKLDSTESIDARSKQVSFTSKKRRALDEVSSQHSVMSEYVKKQKVDKISEETIVDNVVEQLNPIIEDFAKSKEVPTSLVTEKKYGGSSASLDHLLEQEGRSSIKVGNKILPDFNYESTPDLNNPPVQLQYNTDFHEESKKNEFTGFKNSNINFDSLEDNTKLNNQPKQDRIESTEHREVDEQNLRCLLPGIVVNVDEYRTAVVKQVMQDGTCCVNIQETGMWKQIIVQDHDIKVVQPSKHDNIKILSGPMCGLQGTIIGVDNSDGIVRVQDVPQLKILDLNILGIFKNIPDRDEGKKVDEAKIAIDAKQPDIIDKKGDDNMLAKVNDKKDLNLLNYKDWSSYIDEAKKKYFFHDDSMPSFRLFEYNDDRGTYIEEVVLWRPLGMSTEDYDAKIENAKHNYMVMYYSFYKKKNSNTSSIGTKNDYSESRIQCAQRQHNFCDLTESPDEIKELPLVPINSNTLTMSTKSSMKTPSSKRYYKEAIVGRKLFEDDNVFSESSSKDIQCLGIKIFNDSCKQMTSQTDEMYNTRLSLGTASSKTGKENLLPKRILQPSRFLSSPYDNNERRPISVNEYRMYEVLTTLCDDEDYCLNWAINMDNCKVYLEQFGKSFKQDGWVESFVINSFCRKLFKDCHPKQSGKHFFFNTASDYFLEKWKTEDGRIDLKEKTMKSFKGASLARPLHLAERLYFPSIMNLHWFVFAVDLKCRNFLFLDSIYGKNDSFQIIASELLIKNFKIVWHETGQKVINFNKFEKLYPNVPKQKGGNNCGIHSMKMMELYCPRNPAAYAYSDEDVPYFRIRYAIDNLFSKHNTEDSVKKLVTNFDLKSYKEKRQAITIE